MSASRKGPIVMLENPIDIKDIVDNKFPHFSVEDSDLCERHSEEGTEMLATYPSEFLQKFEIPGLTDPDYFKNVKKTMTKLIQNGKVMKTFESEGWGEIPNYDEGVFVLEFYYTAYHEKTVDPIPFDIVAPPKKPKSAVLGRGSIIPGLEIAIKSMKRNERAKFLIHPYLAYRNGILDRIPEDVTILFDVELMNIREANANDLEDRDEELPPDFEKTLQKAINFNEEGNKLKRANKIEGAIKKYERARNTILRMRFKNEEEEKMAYEKVLISCSNLAICYWQVEKYKKVCSMFNNAKYISPSQAYKNVKLLYFSSKALRMLGDYEEAGKRLEIALRIAPSQKELLAEKQMLEKTIINHRKQEKEFFTKMLRIQEPEKESEKIVAEHIREEIDVFLDDWQQLLDLFLSDDVRETVYDISFTENEWNLCIPECAKRNIKIRKEESKIRLIKLDF